MKKIILVFMGIFGVILINSGELDANAIWSLLLFPLFFIGEPWYKLLSRKKRKKLYK